MSELDAACGLLDGAHRSLSVCWEETRAGWNDAARWEFEREYWRPLDERTRAVLDQMNGLAEVIGRARANVE